MKRKIHKYNKVIQILHISSISLNVNEDCFALLKINITNSSSLSNMWLQKNQ